jgi:hypothetical protein
MVLTFSRGYGSQFLKGETGEQFSPDEKQRQLSTNRINNRILLSYFDALLSTTVEGYLKKKPAELKNDLT